MFTASDDELKLRHLHCSRRENATKHRRSCTCGNSTVFCTVWAICTCRCTPGVNNLSRNCTNGVFTVLLKALWVPVSETTGTTNLSMIHLGLLELALHEPGATRPHHTRRQPASRCPVFLYRPGLAVYPSRPSGGAHWV